MGAVVLEQSLLLLSFGKMFASFSFFLTFRQVISLKHNILCTLHYLCVYTYQHFLVKLYKTEREKLKKEAFINLSLGKFAQVQQQYDRKDYID